MKIRQRMCLAGVLAATMATPLTASAGDVVWTSGDDGVPAGSVVWDRSDPNAEWAQWDVFTSSFGGANAPDEGASDATTLTSSVTQNGTSTAFIIGSGVSGNIYSFAEAAAFEVELNGFNPVTPGAGESNILVLSAYTAGTAWDYDNVLLTFEDEGITTAIDALGAYSLFTADAGGGFGGAIESYQWVYDITGATGPLTWTGAAAGSSMSFQQFAADSTVIDASLVPVPEPGSILLMLGGLSMIATRRRSRTDRIQN